MGGGQSPAGTRGGQRERGEGTGSGRLGGGGERDGTAAGPGGLRGRQGVGRHPRVGGWQPVNRDQQALVRWGVKGGCAPQASVPAPGRFQHWHRGCRHRQRVGGSGIQAWCNTGTGTGSTLPREEAAGCPVSWARGVRGTAGRGTGVRGVHGAGPGTWSPSGQAGHTAGTGMGTNLHAHGHSAHTQHTHGMGCTLSPHSPPSWAPGRGILGQHRS